MKGFKRRLAAVLAVCMVLTSVLPAFAGTGGQEDLRTVSEVTEHRKATPSDAEYTAAEKKEKDSEKVATEKTTPSDAKKNAEVFMRETTVDGIKVTLTADPGVFPEDAELWTEKVEDEATEEAIEEAVEKERDRNVNVASSYKFDIKLLADGEEVQPDTTKGTVKISFALEEKLNDCLEVNVYHVTDEDDDLAAETLEAKVETGREVNEEDGALIDGDSNKILSEEISEGTVITAETDGFSYYVVEFTYNELQYVLNGDSSVKLSAILKTLAIEGTVSEAEVSNEKLFTAEKDSEGDDWTVTALKAFSSEEWMKVTIGSQVYEITVTDELDGANTETVKYIDENGTEQSHVCIIMTSSADYSFESDGWYAVKSDITINNRIENKAAVNSPSHLILVDRATLTAQFGIHNPDGKELIIFGQTNNSGELYAEKDPLSTNSASGIGGNEGEKGGKVTINGGVITATGKSFAAGIGGGGGGVGGDVTVNGGTVTATGGLHAPGIGGGKNADGGTLTVNGGNVEANGGESAPGIGCYYSGNFPIIALAGTVTVNGGTVIAKGGDKAAGIGTGYNRDYAHGADVTIHGGAVIGIGSGNAAGIGRGESCFTGADGNLTVDETMLICAGESEEKAKLTSDYNNKRQPYVYISAKTKYTVSHQWQTVVLTGYEEKETETLYGPAGAKTEAQTKTYAGFTAEDFSQETITSDGTTVVNILYKRNTYTITFDTDGRAAVPAKIEKVMGAAIEAPMDPVCEGYKFERWYKDKEYQTVFTFDTMPAENLTLYAKWTLDPSQRQNVQYVDEDGSTKKESCIVLSTDNDFYVFDTGGWYAVTGSITIGNRIENRASEDSPAHLILTDGASLTVKGGIHNPNGKGLVIYGQSGGNGVLTITDVPGENAGIGGNREEGGLLTINGGTVTSTGGGSAAGIGGGTSYPGGKITINGGTVNATGGHYGAGIGGGWRAHAGEITISGGNITAAGNGGAGIGGGYNGPGNTLTFEINPAVLKAGPNKDNFSDVDVDAYKSNNQNYGFVIISYATASYTVEHWKQKTVRGGDYQYDTTETLTGFVNNDAEVISKEYPGYGDPAYTPEKIKMDGTTTIVAKYDLLYSTISFNANGHGTAPDPIYAVPGAEIAAPQAPSEEHYVFGGWYTEAECTNPYTFSTMPSEDLTLYAKWTPVQYNITWKDGANVLRTDKVAYDTMPDYGEDPVKQGYEFLYWRPAVQKVTGDTTYSAIFYKPEENWHKVSFDSQGGTAIPSVDVFEGETVTAPTAPVREKYTFDGWYTDIECMIAYDFATPVTKDFMLYAKWTENVKPKYTITWLIGDSSDTTQVTEGEMPAHANPSKDGYIFIGWNPDLAPVTGDITYTAKFEQRTPDKAAVTFHTDGGSFVETQVVLKGKTAVRPSNPAKSGYRFVNWYTDTAFGTLYAFGKAVTADITLYAKWKKNAGKEYTITWKNWNGTVLATSKVSENGLPKYPGTAKPVRSGYAFTGWTPEIELVTADKTYTATYVSTSSGGGGGGGGIISAAKSTAPTFSPNWYSDEYGVWRIRNSAGQTVANAWLCDDVVKANGQNVWYLLTADGAMIANGLVQDNTGNFYSLETEHNGYFGMLRYQDGTYNCNGQQVYLTFNHEHNGSFGAITNAEGLEKLKAIYGVTKYGIGNENAVYTATF